MRFDLPWGPIMSHWFDDLAKVASKASSFQRRSFIQMLALAGTNLAIGFPFSRSSFAQSTGPSGDCAWQVANKVASHEISLTQDAFVLHRRLSYDQSTRTAAMSGSLTENGALVAQIEVTASNGGGVSGHAIYGPRVSGAKEIALKSSDGKTYEGELDGRAIRRQSGQLIFSDGSQAPTITLDPSLRTTWERLRARVKQRGSGTCRPPRPSVLTAPTLAVLGTTGTSPAVTIGSPVRTAAIAAPRLMMTNQRISFAF
jgi:hypothetical protein